MCCSSSTVFIFVYIVMSTPKEGFSWKEFKTKILNAIKFNWKQKNEVKSILERLPRAEKSIKKRTWFLNLDDIYIQKWLDNEWENTIWDDLKELSGELPWKLEYIFMIETFKYPRTVEWYKTYMKAKITSYESWGSWILSTYKE